MKTQPLSIQAAALASELAKEMGLPPGNLWEPPVARRIAEDLKRMDYQTARATWRVSLGLSAAYFGK